MITLFVLRMLNYFENKRRDKLARDHPDQAVQPEDAAARDLTDREQPGFRYML